MQMEAERCLLVRSLPMSLWHASRMRRGPESAGPGSTPCLMLRQHSRFSWPSCHSTFPLQGRKLGKCSCSNNKKKYNVNINYKEITRNCIEQPTDVNYAEAERNEALKNHKCNKHAKGFSCMWESRRSGWETWCCGAYVHFKINPLRK